MGLFAQHNLTCYLEPRLSERYENLIKEHMGVNPANAPGVKALANHEETWSTTQAAWRLFNNDRVAFPMLAAPMHKLSRDGVRLSTARYALIAHDWCRINFARHRCKRDITQLSHEHDVGYELQASLLIDAATGKPIAPVGLNLLTADGVYQCRSDECQEKQPHLDELVSRIQWQEGLGLGKPLVHVVDREADSVEHLRQLDNRLWLTRGKQDSTLQHEGEFKTLAQIGRKVTTELVGPVQIRGRHGYLFVGETQVTLRRKSEPAIENAPAARLVLSVVTDVDGKELACWYLLSNVRDVSAAEIATWYCWRWNIESWFKLLKSDGFQLEKWQQASGEAIFRRLLVSSMACTMTYKLYHDETEEGQALKRFLVRLSGRVTKRSKPVTLPALLAGLWQFIQLCEVMNNYSMDEINEFRRLASSYFGQLV